MKRIMLENREDLASAIPLESPWVLFIDPSSVCNFKCQFCMNHKIQNPGMMDFGLYTKIIDDLQEFQKPIKVVRLYGFGEPMLNKEFCNMVRYAKQSDKVLSVDTTTNGSRLNPEYNRELIASGIDRINISIEAMNSEKYRDFTGKNLDFKALVRSIEHLYLIRGNTTIFAKICGDYLDDEEISLFYDTFRGITHGCDVEYAMSCWYDIDVKAKNKTLGVYGQPRENIKKCPYIFYSFMIQPDGQASVCFLDWDKKMTFGDAKKQSIKEIWNSINLRMFQIHMLKGSKNKICAACDQLKAGSPANIDDQADEILKRI